MLSKERIEKEIKAIKETTEKLGQIEKDSISGIEVNRIVLEAFKRELLKANRNHK